MKRKRKRTKTFCQKTIAVFLSLNVQVRDEERAVLFTLPLVQLIPALVLLWQFADFGFSILDFGLSTLTRWVSELQRWLNNFRLMLTVAEIGFKSALFGVGVPI